MSTCITKRKGRTLLFLLLWPLTGSVSLAALPPEVVSQLVANGNADMKLPALLKKLELLYKITFVYDADVISKETSVPLHSDNPSLDEVMNSLKQIGISYKKIGDKVILQKAAVPVTHVQREMVVKGTVVQKNREGAEEPLPGITIVEKGTNNGTQSDGAGNFSIKVNDGATLLFTMIGYKPKEIKITQGHLDMKVLMEESISSLGEVVVTGYQNIDKKLFTGSATKLKAEDVKMEGTIDISRMLEGRAAGVSVQNVSGTFGAAPKVRVRGATSIRGENKPLWVIDGVILEDVVNVSNDQLSSGDPLTLIGSSVAGINADDISTFEILKDAAATAMYGARAMNGVIVITTKKGRIGKPLVSYTGNFSTFLKPTYSTFNLMNSADQMSVYAEMNRKGWLNLGPTLTAPNGGVFTKMYQLINTDDPVTGDFALENTPEAQAAFLERYARTNTDWFDILFKNSFVQEHAISISSGTDKSQHYFSASMYNDNGWTVGDNVKRYTMNLNNNYQLSNKLTARVIATGSVREQTAPGSLTRGSNVVEGQYTRDFDINPFSYSLNTSRVLTAYDEDGDQEYFTRNYAPFNILNELKQNTIKLNMLDLKLQGDLNYKINKNWDYTVLGSVRYVKTSREHRITEYSNMAGAFKAAASSTIRERNRFLYSDPDHPEADPQVVLPQGGFYNRNEDYLVSYYARHVLNYKTLIGNHNISWMGGQGIKYANRQNAWNNGYGYQYDKGGTPFTDYRIIKQMLEGNYNYYGMEQYYDRHLEYFTTARYAWKDKYVAEASLRYDGSNQMGASRTARWLPTWTFSGAWNVDMEPFFQQQHMLDFLKVRASYGLNASFGPATNSSVVFNNGSSLRPYLSETESRIDIRSLENSELTWEKNYVANIGVDLGLLKNKLTLTADVYQRNGFDLIDNFRTSGIGGQETKSANYADMKSKGIEFTIGAKILDSRSFSWRTNLTFGYNTGKITNLKSLPRIYDLVIPEGGPKEGNAVRGLYSIDFKGLDPETGTPLFIDEGGKETNNVYLQSTNTSYLHYEGSVDPLYTGGLSNVIRYKDLTLNIFFTYQAGNKIRLNPAYKNTYNDLDAMPKEFLDRWTLPGDEKITNVPSIMDPLRYQLTNGVYPYNTYNYSSVRVADGSFVRLKTVSLQYNLPHNMLSRIGIGTASVNLVGTNLWLVYADKKLKGQDPEFFTSGGVALPVPRQFTFSLKVGL
ncbi:SusC/RagA family TonB-linked outer membrane protein [Chitinophaga sp. SYP-B3965]|uniref:SusC/RagA family TonB-linked outer membrane protein n=1 Tax=Chitinophaga sp. SYP-B3965 TaxID=2663120 RepID=UPI001299D7B8|nr:SusC/RagA family TonB-linked outer membrane protein [Chitinophaga sp. SYP-B3965]MRG49125.1 SusC/RagA family TonB-linked outer membrane protein [Chitinophaga sp. SYP-B3965]